MPVLNLNGKEKKVILKQLHILGDETFEEKKERIALAKKVERSLRRIKPRSAKSKGAGFQKEICELVAGILGIEFDNADDSCEVHSREMGLSGSDVVLRGVARIKFGYGIECKNANTVSLPEWIRQARENAIDGKWLLFIKSPMVEGGPVVVMSVDEFQAIMKSKV